MTGKTTITLAIRRPSKTPPVSLVASFTEPAWKPIELDATPLLAKDPNESADSEDSEYEFSGEFEVPEGSHRYRFRLGSEEDDWVCNEDVNTVIGDDGITNNVLVVKPDSTHPSKTDDKVGESVAATSLSTEENAKDTDNPGESAETEETEEQVAQQNTKEEDEPKPNASSLETTGKPTSDVTAEPVEQVKEAGTTPEAVISNAPSAMASDPQNSNTEASAANETLEQKPQPEESVSPSNNDDVERAAKMSEPQEEEESNSWNPASLPESPIEQTDKGGILEEPSNAESSEQPKTMQEIIPMQEKNTEEAGESESNPWNPASLPESPAELDTENGLPEPPKAEADDMPAANTKTKATEDTKEAENLASGGKLDVKEAEEFEEENQNNNPGDKDTAENTEEHTSHEAKDAPKEETKPSPVIADARAVEVGTTKVADNGTSELKEEELAKSETVTSGVTTDDANIEDTSSTAAPAAKEETEPDSAEQDAAPAADKKDEQEAEKEAVGAAQPASESKASDDVIISETAQTEPEQLSPTDKVAHGPSEPYPNVKSEEVPVQEQTAKDDDLLRDESNDTVADPGVTGEDGKQYEPKTTEEPTSRDLPVEDSGIVSGTDKPAPEVAAETTTEAKTPESDQKKSNHEAAGFGVGLDGQDSSVPVLENDTKYLSVDPTEPVAANEEPEQTVMPSNDADVPIQSEHVEEPAPAPGHVSDKAGEETISVADNQETASPAQLVKDSGADTTGASGLKQGIEVSEVEVTPDNAPKDKAESIGEGAALVGSLDTHQTIGSTTILAPKVAAPVVTADKSEESPVEVSSKHNDLSKEPPIPEPADAKNPEEVGPQEQKTLETEATDTSATAPQPETVVSRESSHKADEPVAHVSNAQPEHATNEGEEQPSSSSAMPADDSLTADSNPETPALEPGAAGESSRPATSKSVASFHVGKKQGFFRAFWQAVFVNFFGGLFAPFRRRGRNRQ